jgi:hypothetical protein
MSVDEALKYIVSMGVVAPPMRNPAGGPRISKAPHRGHIFRNSYAYSLLRPRQCRPCRPDRHPLRLGHRRRDHGGVIFIDLRDREGLAQVVCDPDRKEMFKIAETCATNSC